MLLLDSAPGLTKLRDFLLLTSAHAGFAPEVCRLTVPFPDKAGLASETEFGGFLLKHHEFVSVEPVAASQEKLLFVQW